MSLVGDNMINYKKLENKYKELLNREEKAELYLDNKNIPIEKVMEWIPEYKKILRQLSTLEMILKDKRGNGV